VQSVLQRCRPHVLLVYLDCWMMITCFNFCGPRISMRRWVLQSVFIVVNRPPNPSHSLHPPPQAAVQRMVRYWNDRYKLFRTEKFCMPMTLKGALKDDELAMSRGYVQLLPETDTAGRAIIYIDWSSHALDIRKRAWWGWGVRFLFHVTLLEPFQLLTHFHPSFW
jgi:hypothetical protein